ncbi:uncharacterized protein LOC110859364 isoform X2 [Folsomia candida]|uniref:uncharacterized protein LOC110859364 isoform X2 n=1 Tax=Folsomia candida TaxID=158441 RepID=UPI0016051DBF|nr:uncharacterized protein LOC110859364 isoform X2 [Folsomia candida]
MSCDSSIADLTMMEDEDCREQILTHIKELHEAVVEMKSAFTTAQLQLQSVSGDEEALSRVKTDLETARATCERQGGDILQLVLALKGEVACIKESFQSSQFLQHGLQSSVHTLLLERDLLLDELAKNGAISENLRVRLHSRLNGCAFPRPSSGSHSHQSSNDNDSGVALLLEKAHVTNPFQPLLQGPDSQDAGGSRTHEPSDLASFANHSANANVQEYLNTLQQEGSGGNGHLGSRGNSNPEMVPDLAINGVVYDSDCSLTLAATKSLSLSNSLSKQCGLELDQDDQAVPEGEKGSSLCKGRGGGSLAGGISEPDGGQTFKEGQRLKVAKELLETERKYCHTLRTIQETFAQPLKNSGVLSLKDINTLFPEEVFCLHEKHCQLLSQLEERIASWKSQPRIGDILERFTNGKGSNVLRLYTNYVNDFPEVLKTFHKLCRSSREFTHFLKSSLEHPTCGGLDLGAFLLSPVQRMPRYILLLKQIIKYTEPTHPDFHDITTCLDRLRDYLKRLNDSMEHSFQLVTAQITPQPGDHHNDHNEAEKDKKIGFTNALGLGFGFGSRSGKTNNARSSVCSSQSSHSTTGDVDDESNNRGHKVRYRRSTSVPRSQHHHHNHHASYDHSPTPSKEVLSGGGEKGSSNKLKSRSKSDWTVCKACNCNNQVQPHEENKSTCLDRALSDSDINSDTEESPFLRSPSQEDKNGRKFSTSKSLHDFPNQHPDWFLSQPSLCDGQDDEADVEFPNNKSSVGSSHTVVRNNVMIRPLSSAQGGSRYVARIQRGSSESEMNLHMIGGTTTPPSLEQHKKKTSLRTSLKNIFSLKKRTTRTLQISGPILPSRPAFPPPVATLRYNNGRECYQSLPPEPTHLAPHLGGVGVPGGGRSSRASRLSESPSNQLAPGPASLPPPQPLPPHQQQHQQHVARYARNPGNKFGNPKLPKTPFMAKYHQSQERRNNNNSPYTDV